MRILLDGEYFAEGDSLEMMAEMSGLSIERFSFHIDDFKEHRKKELAEEALSRVRSLFDTDHERDEMIFLIMGAVLGHGVDPRIEKAFSNGQKLFAKRNEVDAAKTEEEIRNVSLG